MSELLIPWCEECEHSRCTCTPTKDQPDAPHYTSLTPEPIDVIDSWGLGFHLGNAIKYIARAGRKGSATAASDLGKAVTYIQRHIASLEGRRAWK